MPTKIQIERGIEMPEGRHALDGALADLRKALLKMKPGESFKWALHYKAPYDAAKQLKIKIATRKINGEGYRVWRVA